MKKVLFATTALIATAGMAAADVRLSGYGRFGLDYNSGNDTVAGVSETNITSRLRLQFDMSTETDSGVALGARFRAQAENRDGDPGGANFNGAQFHAAFEGLRVNVGNIWGAIDNASGLYLPTRSVGTGVDGMGFYSAPILTGLGNLVGWDTYSSSGSGFNGIEALYSAGGFTGHISYSQANGGTIPGNADGEQRTAIMLSYSFSDYFVTGAYQATDNGLVAATGEELTDGLYLLAAGADWGQFGAQISYGATEASDAFTLSGNVDIGAASNLVGWVQSADQNIAAGTNVLNADGSNAVDADGNNIAVGNVDGTSWGINYEYDLGGGSTFVAGYVDSRDDTDQFQAGVYFNF